MSVMTVAASDFRANMLKYVDLAMEQGSSIVVMRHSRPWFEVSPVGSAADIGDLVPANREEVIHAVSEVAERYPAIQKIFMFGSFARGDQSTTSDIDLRLEFAEGDQPSLADVSHFAKEVEQATKREADVVTARTIKNEKLAEAIERDKVLIYER